MKKKLCVTILVCMLVFLGATAAVSAQYGLLAKKNNNQRRYTALSMNQNEAVKDNGIVIDDEIDDTDKLLGTTPDPKGEQNQYQYRYLYDTKGRILFEGTWGHSNDSEPRGYVSGFIGKQHKTGFLKGEFVTYDNSTSGKIAGIFKKGYFNGKIIISDAEPKKITGLYVYDVETRTANLQWMTFGSSGWAEIHVLA